MQCCAVVLAGGHGRRAGGPKALKVIDGQLLWQCMATRFSEAGLHSTVVVLHPSALPAQPPTGVQVVTADPDAPMFASLQRGLLLLPTDLPTLVHPVDAGLPNAKLIQALVSAHDEGLANGKDCDAWQPQVAVGEQGTRRGHPVLLSAQFWQQLLRKDPQMARLDHTLAAIPEERRGTLPWDDAAVLANYNRDGVSH